MSEQGHPLALVTANDIMMVHFERHFSAAHRIPAHQGHCKRIHGHNYFVTVDISADALSEVGFVVEWATVKNIIDKMDHKFVIDIDDPVLSIFRHHHLADEFHDWFYVVTEAPSTEYLAQHLAVYIGHAVRQENARATYVNVTVSLQETPAITAIAGWQYDQITDSMRDISSGIMAADGDGQPQVGQSTRAHLSSLR